MVWLLVSVVIVIILSLAIQGWMVMSERYGYYKNSELPPSNNHPEMNGYRPGEKLLVAKFDDYKFDQLAEKALRKKMEELFHEPSSFEDDDDDSLYVR
jgi:hypothetical protein